MGPTTDTHSVTVTIWELKIFWILEFYTVFFMSGKQNSTMMPWGSFKALKVKVVIWRVSFWIFPLHFHTLSNNSLKIMRNVAVSVIYITKSNHMQNFVQLPRAFHSTSSYCMCSSHLRLVNILHGWMLTLDVDLVLNCRLLHNHWFVCSFTKPEEIVVRTEVVTTEYQTEAW